MNSVTSCMCAFFHPMASVSQIELYGLKKKIPVGGKTFTQYFQVVFRTIIERVSPHPVGDTALVSCRSNISSLINTVGECILSMGRSRKRSADSSP